MSELEQLISSQNERTIKYEEDGKTKSRKVILQEPSARASAMIMNEMSGANGTMYLGNVLGLVMDNAIVSPKLSYESLNKDVPDNLKSKIVELTNGNGKKVKFKMKFPDWRTALNLTTLMSKNDGSNDFVGMMDALLADMLYDTEDHKLTWDWFDDKDKGYGLMNNVIRESQEYIGQVTNRKGIIQVLLAGFQLVQSKIRGIRPVL